MEKNIRLEVITDYHDIEFDKVILKGTKRWVTEKRARQLFEKEVVRLSEIRKCIYESRKANKNNEKKNIK